MQSQDHALFRAEPPGLLDDLTDVAIWLAETHPDGDVLWVDVERHYRHSDRQLAYVVTVSDHPDTERRRSIRAAAERALTALGYTIEPVQGADTYSPGCSYTDDVSAHRRLAAYRRVRDALAAYDRQTDV